MSDSKRSMVSWAMQTHQQAPGTADNRRLQTEARSIYDRDAPTSGLPRKTRTQEREHLQGLQDLGASSPDIQVYPQSAGKSTTVAQHYRRVGHEAAASEFSYRIMPTDRSGIKSSGRVTLSFDPSRSVEVAGAMASQLMEDPNVPQTKMMGPRNLGQRADDAILYTKEHAFSKAAKTGREFGARFSTSPFVAHTPLGMEPLPGQTGRSYSEAVSGLSSSHGSARKVVIAEAVESLRALGGARPSEAENLSGHVGYSALKHGLNPEAPAFAVTQARTSTLAAIRDPGTHQRLRDRNTDKRVSRATGLGMGQASTFRKALLARYGVG